MEYAEYQGAYFVNPPPEPRFGCEGIFGITLYFEGYEAAVEYYQEVLGPPAYVEGDSTRGWQVGGTWLTLLRGRDASPVNVEVMLYMQSPGEANRLQSAFLQAGGVISDPVDTLMYEPVHLCPAVDPFGTNWIIVTRMVE